MTNIPHRVTSVERLALNAIGYLIQDDLDEVAYASEEWGVKSVTTAVESMHQALRLEANPAPRARIRKVS
jgi:hypothetical protein